MADPEDPKQQHLRKHGALYADAEVVVDPLFDHSEFFDPRDLVLVKYEMLRRVQIDRIPVVEAAKRFGFSRAGFYKTLAAFQRLGLVGLIPARPGPRQAHKLTDAVLEFIDAQLAERGPLAAADLAALIFQEREVCVHPRSIERALARRKKRGR